MVTVSKRYNEVIINEAEELVEKIYRQGPVTERFDHELEALLKVPELSEGCRVPHIIYSDRNPQGPVVCMTYIPHEQTLADHIAKDSSTVMGNLEQILKFMDTLSVNTNHRYGVPAPLKAKLDTYPEKYADVIDSNILERICHVREKLGVMPISKAHGDLRLNNVLEGKDGNIHVIDWEHFSDNAQAYDMATMLVNSLVILYTVDKPNQIDACAEMFEHYASKFGKDFYVNMIARTLVEFSPAVAREEYLKKEQMIPFLNKLLDASLKGYEQDLSLRQVLGEVASHTGNRYG